MPYLLLLLLLFPKPADAEESILGEVIVTPPTPQATTPTADSTMSATVIEASEWKGRNRTLPEVLEESAGLSVKRYGGLNDFATVSIRGSTSEQVAVYVDGVLINATEGGGVNLATLPLGQIERIEVYRGAAPARFMTSSLGGVVSITTKGGKPATDFSQSYGSWNTLETSLSQSQRFRSRSYSVGYQFGHSDGDFSFSNDNGTPFNPTDDRTVARQNNKWNRHHLRFGLGQMIAAGGATLQGNFSREDRGVPGLGPLPSTEADLATTRAGAQLNWKQQGWGLSPFFQFQKQQFSDPNGEIGLGTQQTDDDIYAYGLQSTSSFLIGSHQIVTLAAAYRGESFLPEELLQPGTEDSSNRHQASLGIEDELAFLEDRLTLNPSVRTEYVRNDFAASQSTVIPVSGKLGVRCRLGNFALISNGARAYRLPNFSELFGDRGNLLGNPDLKPERGWNWDIGGEWEYEGFRVGTNYFLNHVEDLIQLLQTSQFTAEAQNLSSARLQGVESFASLPVTDFMNVATNYTFQWAKDTSGLPGTDGNLLPGRPRHEATGRVEFHRPLGKVFSELTFMDGNFLDSQNLLRVSHRLLLTTGVTVLPAKHIRFGVEGKNLLNDRVVDVVGFPLPGRSFYGKVEISL